VTASTRQYSIRFTVSIGEHTRHRHREQKANTLHRITPVGDTPMLRARPSPRNCYH